MADLEYDPDGRWTGAVSDEISRMNKRLRKLGRPIKIEINEDGMVELDEAKETLNRHGCDVLIAGRVGADGSSSVVRVLNKQDGIIDEVTLEGEKKDRPRIEQMARLNLAIEEGVARNMDKEGILGKDSFKTLPSLEIAKERIRHFREQALYPKTEIYADINIAALNIKIGNEVGNVEDLQEAREIMKIAYNKGWYGSDNNTAALQIANTYVFEGRINGEMEKLKEGKDWYYEAAEQAEKIGDYKQWIVAYDAAVWTSVEIYMSTGDRYLLDSAKLEQEQAVELCQSRLSGEDYSEPIGILAGIKLLIASLDGNSEGILDAKEELISVGRLDILGEMSSMGGKRTDTELDKQSFRGCEILG